ncbi:MAG: cation transporter, partial [Acidobacteria bacterium]|nr:cation transporter [Acidobacteriota bacterium]
MADTHDHDDHEHHHHVHLPTGGAAQRRALRWALAANGVYLVVEVAGGLAFHSLALLADAGHMLSDVAGLVVALVAARLVEQPASERHSYGFQRAEVLGAQANAVALLVVSGVIVVTAVGRIGDPVDVRGGGLVLVAAVGLLVNVASAVMLARAAGQSLNIRGAYLHMLLDAAGSVAAIGVGIAVAAWQADWTDPVVSIVLAALVLWSAWSLLRETAIVLLESTPRGVDPSAVEGALRDDPAVEAVHHLHVWSLASDVPALSAHVVLTGELTLHEAQAEGERLKVLLEDRFAITDSTLELECHPCDPANDHVARVPESSRHG